MTMRTTVAIGVDIHFGPGSIGHQYRPADDKCHAYGVIKIDSGGAVYANLYFDNDPAHVDKMIAELVALKQEMAPPVLDVKAPAPEGNWCPASTDMEDFGATIYCDREDGHIGSHHAPGPDEGSEVAWSDCDGGRDSAAASQQCVIHAGHDGAHRDAHGCEWSTAPKRCEDEAEASGKSFFCTLNTGHPGLHAQLTATGAFMAEWGFADGHVHTTSGRQPAPELPAEKCPATQYGGIVCIRDKGHDGDHYDNTGAAHAWNDEPVSVTA